MFVYASPNAETSLFSTTNFILAPLFSGESSARAPFPDLMNKLLGRNCRDKQFYVRRPLFGIGLEFSTSPHFLVDLVRRSLMCVLPALPFNTHTSR